LVEKPEGKIKDHIEIWWEGVNWMYLAQERVHGEDLVNVVMNLCVP
jgi:hypothetical protein